MIRELTTSFLVDNFLLIQESLISFLVIYHAHCMDKFVSM